MKIGLNVKMLPFPGVHAWKISNPTTKKANTRGPEYIKALAEYFAKLLGSELGTDLTIEIIPSGKEADSVSDILLAGKVPVSRYEKEAYGEKDPQMSGAKRVSTEEMCEQYAAEVLEKMPDVSQLFNPGKESSLPKDMWEMGDVEFDIANLFFSANKRNGAVGIYIEQVTFLTPDGIQWQPGK